MKDMQPPKRLKEVKKIFAVDVDHLTDETFTSQIMNSKRKKNVHLGKKILLDNICFPSRNKHLQVGIEIRTILKK